MTREAISLTIPDISAFAKALRREAGDDDTGHQAWLNRIARAAGYRNFQHLSATRKGAEPPADARAVARALRWFDDRGRMTAWPSKTGVQKLCLWGLWARLPRGLSMTEREVSAAIDEWSTFGRCRHHPAHAGRDATARPDHRRVGLYPRRTAAGAGSAGLDPGADTGRGTGSGRVTGRCAFHRLAAR